MFEATGNSRHLTPTMRLQKPWFMDPGPAEIAVGLNLSKAGHAKRLYMSKWRVGQETEWTYNV